MFLLIRSFVISNSAFHLSSLTIGQHKDCGAVCIGICDRLDYQRYPDNHLGSDLVHDQERSFGRTSTGPSRRSNNHTYHRRRATGLSIRGRHLHPHPRRPLVPSRTSSVSFATLWIFYSFLAILISNPSLPLILIRHIVVLCIGGVVVFVLADSPVRSSFQHGRWRYELGIRLDTHDVPSQDRTRSRKAHRPPQRRRRRIHLMYPSFALCPLPFATTTYLIIKMHTSFLSAFHSTPLKAKVFSLVPLLIDAQPSLSYLVKQTIN